MACLSYKVKSKYTVDPLEFVGEKNTLPSDTVPDQSLTVKDILFRFSKGLPLDNLERPLVYGDSSEQHEDNFDVHPSNQFGMDYVDVMEAQRANVAKLSEFTERLKNANDEQNDEREKEAPPKNVETSPKNE